jgi:site-specific DNA recombinase
MASLKNLIKEYEIKNVVNYLRKSRQDEDRERKTGEDTLHEQKKLMDRVLADYGIPYDQRPEVGSGDKIATRPVFQQVIEDIKMEKYDAIAVKEISRMGRGSYTDMGIIYDLIQDKRLFIITPWKVYDPTNNTDLRQIRFELFMSREEFETTRERLTGGRYNAALEGKWVAGRSPFGYDYDSNTKHLVINDKEAEVIRSVYDFYLNGIIQDNGKRKLVQFKALSTYLNRLGIKSPAGKDWSYIAVQRILLNDLYAGTIRFNTKMTTGDGKRVPRPESEHVVVKDAHEAIIDQETWDKVQDRMNKRDTVPHNKLDFNVSELASLCRCVKCGKKMVRQYSTQHYKKADGSKSIYHKEFLWCTINGCTFVKYRSIEEDLLETLRMLGDLDNQSFKAQMDMLAVKKESKGLSQADIQKSIDMRRGELERRMKFIFEKYEAGIYTDEMFLERKAEIEKEKDGLKNLHVEVPEVEKTDDIDIEAAKQNIKSILETYKVTDHKSDKNAILRSIFDHVDIEILEKGRGRKPAKHRITPYLKLSFLAQKTV